MDLTAPISHRPVNALSVEAKTPATSGWVQLSTANKQKGKRKIDQVEVSRADKKLKLQAVDRKNKTIQSQFIVNSKTFNRFVQLIRNPLIDLQKKAITHLRIAEYTVAKEQLVKLLNLKKGVHLNNVAVSSSETDDKIIKKVKNFNEKAFSSYQILDFLGFTSFCLGENEQAKAYLLESYKLKKSACIQSEARLSLLHTINLLRKVSIHLQEYEIADSYLKEAEALLASNPDLANLPVAPTHQDIAENLASIGYQLYNDESYEQAKVYFQKAIKVLESSAFDCSDEKIEYMSVIGTLSYKLGNNEEAKQYFENALELLSQSLEKDEDLITHIYQHLGTINYELKAYDKAKDYFSDAIQCLKARSIPHKDELASTINRKLGKTYYRLGKHQEAKSSLEAAIARFHPYNDQEEATKALNVLGKVNFQLDLYDAAIQNWKDALEKTRELGAEQSPFVTKIKLRIATASLALGKLNGIQDLIQIIGNTDFNFESL